MPDASFDIIASALPLEVDILGFLPEDYALRAAKPNLP
jgi:hypothetical protein